MVTIFTGDKHWQVWLQAAIENFSMDTIISLFYIFLVVTYLKYCDQCNIKSGILSLVFTSQGKLYNMILTQKQKIKS